MQLLDSLRFTIGECGRQLPKNKAANKCFGSHRCFRSHTALTYSNLPCSLHWVGRYSRLHYFPESGQSSKQPSAHTRSPQRLPRSSLFYLASCRRTQPPDPGGGVYNSVLSKQVSPTLSHLRLAASQQLHRTQRMALIQYIVLGFVGLQSVACKQLDNTHVNNVSVAFWA